MSVSDIFTNIIKNFYSFVSAAAERADLFNLLNHTYTDLYGSIYRLYLSVFSRY